MDRETRYLAERLRILLNEEGVTAMKVCEMARRRGRPISDAAIINFKNGKNGAGNKLRKALLAVFDLSEAELESESAAWDSGETVIRPERYPNREIAAKFAQANNVPEEAIEIVLGYSLKSFDDPTPEEWFEMMKAEKNRAKMLGGPQSEAVRQRELERENQLIEEDDPPWNRR